MSLPPLPNLVGRSDAFQNVLRQAKQLACVDAPVLIEGETGTGKELIARAMHYLGQRAECPFIPVNCGAIPDGLIESELFGHTRGAFTDAWKPHHGLVAQASGGTLFLDEVDGLSAKGQVTLLRFLQDMRYRPLGARHEERADVRILAAANADLQALVDERRLRPDLFFRLKILALRLPPLRERTGDARVLAEYFIALYGRRYGRPPKPLDPDTADALDRYPWPGNVRELENLVHRAFLLCDGPTVRIAELAAAHGGPAREQGGDLAETSFTRAKAYAIATFERSFLSRALARTEGNVTLAAQLCGKERRSFGRLLKKHGINRNAYGRSR